MSRGRPLAVLHDRELLELLADDPALLAIADAIAATGARSQRRRPPRRLLLAVVALVVAASVALIAPWSTSRGGVVQKALAAVSSNSVLHVVLVSPLAGESTVNLKTGTSKPAVLRVEQWFD